jgi:glucose/arabinose dehydrogenase
MQTTRLFITLVLLAAFAACSTAATAPDPGIGAQPELPESESRWFPTVNIAPAVGWPKGLAPVPAAGTRVQLFADDLEHPRWLYVLPNGDVLVAETNAPPRSEAYTGVLGWVARQVMKRAGAGVPSANRISLLRDGDGDGVVDLRSTFLEGLNSPFGMALVGDRLYVANTDAVVHFPYVSGQTRIEAPASLLVELPGGPINSHWTKGLLASADGRKLYVSVGSNSNIAERGLPAEEGRAAIWEIDIATTSSRIFASGLRNPVGMAWEAQTGELWTVVNERDELGDNLVPDYLTSVRDGDFFGWPWSYFGQYVDVRVDPQNPQRVAQARAPDFALGSHVAALGLASARGNSLPEPFAEGMFIGLHGSWNRNPHSGYKVIYVPFAEGRPSGMPVDVLSTFLSPQGKAYGRPVGVTLDRQGALLVADDVGRRVWRVSTSE